MTDRPRHGSRSAMMAGVAAIAAMFAAGPRGLGEATANKALYDTLHRRQRGHKKRHGGGRGRRGEYVYHGANPARRQLRAAEKICGYRLRGRVKRTFKALERRAGYRVAVEWARDRGQYPRATVRGAGGSTNLVDTRYYGAFAEDWRGLGTGAEGVGAPV